TYPPIRKAPPAADIFKNERLVNVLLIMPPTRLPRDESRGESVDKFHSGRCCRPWRHRYRHPWVSVSLRAERQRTSIARTGNNRTAAPARRSMPPAADDWTPAKA